MKLLFTGTLRGKNRHQGDLRRRANQQINVDMSRIGHSSYYERNKQFYYPLLHFSETGKTMNTTENNNNLTLESGVRQVELGVSSALDTSKVRDEGL